MAEGWDVLRPYIEDVTVAEGDADGFGHTNNVVYLQWLERVAWAHSEMLGLTMDDYRRLGCGCVARQHELTYLAATHPGDRLQVGTWIHSNDGRLSLWRCYQVRRPKDGRTVLRGRTHWVCVDLASGRPRRMPPEFVEAYQPMTGTPSHP